MNKTYKKMWRDKSKYIKIESYDSHPSIGKERSKIRKEIERVTKVKREQRQYDVKKREKQINSLR